MSSHSSFSETTENTFSPTFRQHSTWVKNILRPKLPTPKCLWSIELICRLISPTSWGKNRTNFNCFLIFYCFFLFKFNHGHFLHIHSKTYQTDECFNCGAALEDNNLFINSSGTSKKSSTENSVRCCQCRVCESTNVILEQFRAVISSSRSIPILPTGSDATSQFSQTNHFIRHHMRTKSTFETPAMNSTVNTFPESSSSCV